MIDPHVHPNIASESMPKRHWASLCSVQTGIFKTLVWIPVTCATSVVDSEYLSNKNFFIQNLVMGLANVSPEALRIPHVLSLCWRTLKMQTHHVIS